MEQRVTAANRSCSPATWRRWPLAAWWVAVSRCMAGRERLAAAVLFADISGFTALTERLARTGPAGVEELTELLNDCFGRLVKLVVDHGGDVVKFAGDALLALWPADEAGRGDDAPPAAGWPCRRCCTPASLRRGRACRCVWGSELVRWRRRTLVVSVAAGSSWSAARPSRRPAAPSSWAARATSCCQRKWLTRYATHAPGSRCQPVREAARLAHHDGPAAPTGDAAGEQRPPGAGRRFAAMCPGRSWPDSMPARAPGCRSCAT